MSDDFNQLIDDSNRFFAELAQNNTKDWFTPRKDTYVRSIKRPAELLGDVLSQKFEALTGRTHRAKVFRIHRDVRFSKDKTPYNVHLHLSWSQAGRDGGPSWFLGSAPDYLTFGCGAMAMDKGGLDQYRKALDQSGTVVQAELDKVQKEIQAHLSDYGPAPLKRVPKPYAADHPQAELLKRKSFAVFAPYPDNWRNAGLVETACGLASQLLPLWSWQDEVFGH